MSRVFGICKKTNEFVPILGSIDQSGTQLLTRTWVTQQGTVPGGGNRLEGGGVHWEGVKITYGLHVIRCFVFRTMFSI